jgi:hypothetical protein
MSKDPIGMYEPLFSAKNKTVGYLGNNYIELDHLAKKAELDSKEGFKGVPSGFPTTMEDVFDGVDKKTTVRIIVGAVYAYKAAKAISITASKLVGFARKNARKVYSRLSKDKKSSKPEVGGFMPLSPELKDLVARYGSGAEKIARESLDK